MRGCRQRDLGTMKAEADDVGNPDEIGESRQRRYLWSS